MNRRGLPKGTLASVLERDNYRCAYGPDGCGGGWTADHVIPRSLAIQHEVRIGYGANHPDNLAACCLTHNQMKYTRRFVPRSWKCKLDWLNDLGIGTFRVWDGSVEALREVVR